MDDETIGSSSERSGSPDEYIGEAVIDAPPYADLPLNGFVLHGGSCASCAAQVPVRTALAGAPRPYGWCIDDAEACAPLCDACLSYIRAAPCCYCEALAAPAHIDARGRATCIYCVCVHDQPAPRARPCGRCAVVTDRLHAQRDLCLVCAAFIAERRSARPRAPPERWA